MNKKLQVFISSTYIDMKEERQAAVEAILSAGHIPAGMELFSAGNESQIEVIKRWIDESDVYMLILGGRYGSIEPITGKSYIHLEYEYAINKGVPVFAVVIDEKALYKKAGQYGKEVVIESENLDRLTEFRTLALSKISEFFEDKKDIKLAIHKTLSDFNKRYKLFGWISGKEYESNMFYADKLAKLIEQNTILKNKNEELTKQVNKLVNQKSETKSKIKFTITSDISKRIDRILELMGADEQADLVWFEDNIEYSVKDASGTFTYYYVYFSNEIVDDTSEIAYTLVMSVDNSISYNIYDELASIRIMLEDHKKVGDTMKFKYVIASTKIVDDFEEKCTEFFNIALDKANIKNKDTYTFEIWNEKKISSLEESLGLKVNLQP